MVRSFVRWLSVAHLRFICSLSLGPRVWLPCVVSGHHVLDKQTNTQTVRVPFSICIVFPFLICVWMCLAPFVSIHHQDYHEPHWLTWLEPCTLERLLLTKQKKSWVIHSRSIRSLAVPLYFNYGLVNIVNKFVIYNGLTCVHSRFTFQNFKSSFSLHPLGKPGNPWWFHLEACMVYNPRCQSASEPIC